MSVGPVASQIQQKVTGALAPEHMELVDDSWRHAGHHHEGGIDARPGGESHFSLTVVSAAFEGLGRLARQRAVMALLKDEMSGPVHALSITALTPQEWREKI